MSCFDALIIGCGPGGERAAIQAARAGKRVAVVERANVVGGTRVNWGTIPSKTLRESALFIQSLTRKKQEGIHYRVDGEITIGGFMYREKLVVQRELELINKTLDRYQIEVFQSHARFVDPHTVALIGGDGQSRMTLQAEFFVVATGTSPNHPPDIAFDQRCIFDSDTVLKLPRMPRSMTVLGAGVIGLEYASIFSALGVEVTLVDTRSELLPYMDREIAGILERELRQDGMMVLHDEHYRAIHCGDSPTPRVQVETSKGNLIEADVLLYCVGRDGNTRDLGLDKVGLQPDARGLLPVNEHFQTDVPHIYAVGDVVGYPALASTAMEQGRQAMRHAFNLPGTPANAKMLPFAIYSIPEVSYIGESERTLQQQGLAYVSGRGRYRLNPRGQIIGQTGGLLKLLFDRDDLRLLGVHIVGANASELVHTGQAFMQAGATAGQIAETLFNYPTLSDLYRHAALEALAAARGG